ncbi:MAG: YdcF family protein, partial [Deltaproteobacteria bacterium]|nr:YdcF family protein [Deltaproteobacteria bacterium]
FMPIVGNERFALVTSACHLPRALEQFRAKGTKPIPCPCDFRTKQTPPLLFLLIPGGGLENSQIALHEYYGRLFYWLTARVAPASVQAY